MNWAQVQKSMAGHHNSRPNSLHSDIKSLKLSISILYMVPFLHFFFSPCHKFTRFAYLYCKRQER